MRFDERSPLQQTYYKVGLLLFIINYPKKIRNDLNHYLKNRNVMDKKLEEKIIGVTKIVALLFFLIVLLTTLVWPGADILTNLFLTKE